MAMRGERGYLGQDLDYTLRAFPNHHRALIALQRYEARLQSIGVQDRLPRPVECYYERAVRWRPKDPVVRMIYAQFLYRQNRGAEAAGHLQAAESLAGDNGFTHYNIGLVYMEGKDYVRAREQASRALELGFERATLREQLAALGQWQPAAAPAEAASAVAPR
jgi:Tfp pilus assembly protein PilF